MGETVGRRSVLNITRVNHAMHESRVPEEDATPHTHVQEVLQHTVH